MSYEQFALFYDRLTIEVDYKARTDYLLSLFKKYDRLPTLCLDMACGTGGFTRELKASGMDVIGVDPCSSMLSVAHEKLPFDTLLLCQKADELELYGTVDGAVCCLDSFNHITDYDELVRSLQRISLFLEPNRLLIFDVNTVYKHRNILSGETFVYDMDDVYCVWQNSVCDKNNMININLDFFEYSQENESYFRSEESFCERAYDEQQLNAAVNEAGLETVAILGDLTFELPKSDEQRVFYVTRKELRNES
ncbi:MAG: class I SAM-dependent methyltransferase [Oscillospiraceae bacterium]